MWWSQRKLKEKKMLNDDFKTIEDFLKAEGNLELLTLQKFEVVVNDLIDGLVQNNAKESFSTLNLLVFHSYSEFEKSSDSIVKDFTITILVIKKLIVTLQTKDSILSEEDKTLYMELIKQLMESFKKELNSHLGFFKEFIKYIDGINVLLDVKE
jgi:hypothetical protein